MAPAGRWATTVAVILACSTTGCGSGSAHGGAHHGHGPTFIRGLRQARAFREYPLFWLGRSFGTLELTGDVVIFFAHPDDAGAALRGIGALASVLSGEPLPKPVPRAIAGHLRCLA